MTGLEFRETLILWCAAPAAFLIAPAVLISLLRRWTTCDNDFKISEGCLGASALVILAIVGLYSVFLWKMWDDNQHIATLLLQPLVITIIVTLHVLVVVGLAKVLGLLFPPKETNICTEMYLYLFVGLGLLWFDLSKGNKSVLVTWLGS